MIGGDLRAAEIHRFMVLRTVHIHIRTTCWNAGCRSDVFEQLLPDACASVLCLLQLEYPVVDARVQFRQPLFLFQDCVMREPGNARKTDVTIDAIVEVAAASAERAVSATEVVTTFVEGTEFL